MPWGSYQPILASSALAIDHDDDLPAMVASTARHLSPTIAAPPTDPVTALPCPSYPTSLVWLGSD